MMGMDGSSSSGMSKEGVGSSSKSSSSSSSSGINLSAQDASNRNKFTTYIYRNYQRVC